MHILKVYLALLCEVEDAEEGGGDGEGGGGCLPAIVNIDYCLIFKPSAHEQSHSRDRKGVVKCRGKED